MRQRSFEYNYTGVNFILDLYIDVELEFDEGGYQGQPYRGFSFSVEYPEDIMVTPEEHKKIEKEVSLHINDKFMELYEGSYYGYY